MGIIYIHKQLVIFLAVLIVLLSCGEEKESNYSPIPLSQLPEIGEKIQVTYSTSTQIMVSSSQFYPEMKINLENVQYSLGFDNASIVKYIATNDSTFATPESLKIGDLGNEVLKYAKSQVRVEPGWGYYVEISDGWNAGFINGNEMTGKPWDDSLKVVWFFKR